MIGFLEALRRDEGGQDLVEYTLLIVLLALAVVAAIEYLGGTLNSTMENAGSEMQSASGS